MATVKLTWDTDFVVNETGYRVYRSTSPIDTEDLPAPIATLGPGVDSYDDDTVDPGVLYYYVVSSFRANGDEEFANEVFRETTFRSFGFVAKGSRLSPIPSNDTRVIDRYPFSNPFTTSTQIGVLPGAIGDFYSAIGVSSPTKGFVISNNAGTHVFPFTSEFTSALAVSSLSAPHTGPPILPNNIAPTSVAISGLEEGYVNSNLTIQSFPFASPYSSYDTVGQANSTTPLLAGASGHQSSVDGFMSSGRVGDETFITSVQSFPFSNPFTSSEIVGDISEERAFGSNHSSVTHGFTGYQAPLGPFVPNGLVTSTLNHNFNALAIQERFPFVNPFTKATNVGTISWRRLHGNSNSSFDGYTAGDSSGPPSPQYSVPIATSVQSFPFSAPYASLESVGGLSNEYNWAAGFET